ncbi:MAG TPA: hypothetical protein PKJ95_00500, partial [Atribacterota bacterium]|nr:hypothetical protein [Atribacterota bacterium]
KNPQRQWENEIADIISKVMRISKKEAEIEIKLALSEARLEYPEKLQNIPINKTKQLNLRLTQNEMNYENYVKCVVSENNIFRPVIEERTYNIAQCAFECGVKEIIRYKTENMKSEVIETSEGNVLAVINLSNYEINYSNLFQEYRKQLEIREQEIPDPPVKECSSCGADAYELKNKHYYCKYCEGKYKICQFHHQKV